MSALAPLSKKRKGSQLTPAFEPVADSGTWTPVLTAGIAFNVNANGFWSRVGNVVTIQAYIDVNTTVGVSGTSSAISGLPFLSRSAATGAPNFSTINIAHATLTLNGTRAMVVGRLGPGASSFPVISYGGATSIGFDNTPAAAYSGSSFLYLNGTYMCEDEPVRLV